MECSDLDPQFFENQQGLNVIRIDVPKGKQSNPQMSQTAADSRDEQTHAIIGAAMEVHRQLGSGFLEAVYQDALEIEFRVRSIPFRREVELPVHYKGQRLSCSYRADFVCYDQIIVELKALRSLVSKMPRY